MNSRKPAILRIAESRLLSQSMPVLSLLVVLLVIARCSGIPKMEDKAPPFDPSISGGRVCLSMRALLTAAKGTTLSEEVKHLAGIGWLEGYILDPENHDVILLGRRSPQWPNLHIDDLAMNIRNEWNGNSYPYCSLDPQAEDVMRFNRIVSGIGVIKSTEQMHSAFERIKNAWGDQRVIIGGVPRNSRYAQVMIDADYHMKKLSQGLVEVKGIPSLMDLVVAEAQRTLKQAGTIPDLGVSMSRFWFHIEKGHPTYEHSKGILLLEQCSVVLLTEKQRATADGGLYDSGEDDTNANIFAEALSKRFRYAATVVPEYANLENLFRLHALLRAMHMREAAKEASLDLSVFLSEYRSQSETSMPPSMPGLVNRKQVTDTISRGNVVYQYVLFPMVCGGVSMEIEVHKEQFIDSKRPYLRELRIAVLSSRPHRNSLWWELK